MKSCTEKLHIPKLKYLYVLHLLAVFDICTYLIVTVEPSFMDNKDAVILNHEKSYS